MKPWRDKNSGVVKGYEVIDGQQRLTTIYLLLTALFCKDSRNKEEVRDFKMFSICYQTREDSREFLEKVADDQYRTEKRLECVDFYHLDMVFDAFKSELKKLSNEHLGFDRDLIKLILGEEIKPTEDDIDEDIEITQEDCDRLIDRARNVRVIWYEIGADEKASAEEIFTRLNIGKIPLNNAELIKALFLKESNFGKITATKEKEQRAQQLGIALRQNKIAEEWNYIERKLQREDFWYFLGAASFGKEYEARIEFIFDLKSEWRKDMENYHTFNYFLNSIRIRRKSGKRKTAENVWKEVKDYFRELEYWYNNRELYHLIGFLIECGSTISDLMALRDKKERNDKGEEVTIKLRKDEFLLAIKEKVRESMRKIDIDSLTYSSNKEAIKKVLLLFNVLSVIDNQNSDIRFPFDKYKKEKWDLEHIASQIDKDKAEVPKEHDKRTAWIDDMLYYFTGVRDKDAKDAEGNQTDNADEMTLYVINQVKKYVNGLTAEKEQAEIVKKLLEAKEHSVFISNHRSTPDNKEKYDSLMKQLFVKAKEFFRDNRIGEQDRDGLGNMALLNASINRSYGNAFFAIKRMHIQDKDAEGLFIPLATKNVFMKYYSKRVDNMLIWTSDDAKEYVGAIKKKLLPFLE